MTSRDTVYHEGHSALNGRFLILALLAPGAGLAACAVLAIIASPVWFGGVGVMAALGLMTTGLLYRNWPTGIRIDQSAISVGAVGSAAAGRRTPTVNHQAWGLFTSPWPAALDVRVVTDPAQVRELRKARQYDTMTNRWAAPRAMRHCNVGVLSSPLMTAALVIDIRPGAVTTPQVRPARFYSNFMGGSLSRLLQPAPSPTWVIPTRHPDAVRQALEALGPGQPRQ
ncbi:MAG TPA: hypothetical protein VGM79_12725 [Streptosporangiaceae bacterium]|jgi:hypothetical protein